MKKLLTLSWDYGTVKNALLWQDMPNHRKEACAVINFNTQGVKRQWRKTEYVQLPPVKVCG
jgi:hypothetical protein